jgi:hypothetical protein
LPFPGSAILFLIAPELLLLAISTLLLLLAALILVFVGLLQQRIARRMTAG